MKKISFLVLSLFLIIPVFAATSVQRLAKHLVSSNKGLRGQKIAVLAFPYHDGKISSGSSIVAERMTTQMVGMKGIQVMERRLLKKILEEKKLSETGIIDSSMAKKLGSVLGVDAIITGTLIDMDGNKTEINARIIDGGTGEILSAGTGLTDRVWSDNPRFVYDDKHNKEAKEQFEERVTKEEIEEDPEEYDMEEDNDTPTAAKPEPKKVLKFSNESFSPGRRFYHSTNGAQPKKTKGKSGSQYETDEYESSSSSYDDGYQDGVRDYVQDSRGSTRNKNRDTFKPSYGEKQLGIQQHYERTTYERRSGTGVGRK